MKVNPREVSPGLPDAIIIIFGAAVRPDGRPSGTLRYRVEAAVRFGARFERPLFIPTGGKGRFGDPEATVMARMLREAGHPDEAIVEEKTGTDTLSSALAVARLTRGRAPVYACSSSYHLTRCLILLRLAGIPARPCPPPIVPATTSRWRRCYWHMREMPALPYDALLMLWMRVSGRT